MRKRKTLAEKFWWRVDKNGPVHPHNPELGNCWLWVGDINRGGYGHFKHEKREVRSHRASWEINKGKIKDGMCICHSCDRRACIRPEHLFEDTQKANLADARKKGRLTLENLRTDANRKLNWEQVTEIRNTPYVWGLKIRLAEKFGVDRNTIAAIRSFKTYKTP